MKETEHGYIQHSWKDIAYIHSRNVRKLIKYQGERDINNGESTGDEEKNKHSSMILVPKGNIKIDILFLLACLISINIIDPYVH